MRRACRHPNVFARIWAKDGQWIILLGDSKHGDARRCGDCHAWLSLGPSSDDSPEVAIELYALEQLDWARGRTADERNAIPDSGEMCGVGCIYCEGAYLACAISSHATTEGE